MAEEQRVRKRSSVSAERSNLLLKIPTKRRVSNTCLVCRTRKVRCDQAKPTCGECVERNVPHLCTYTGIEWNHCSVEAVPLSGQRAPSKQTPNELRARIVELEDELRVARAASESSRKSSLSPFANDAEPDFNPQEFVSMYHGLHYFIPFVMKKSRLELQGAFSAIYTFKADVHLRIIWIHMFRFLDKAMRSAASMLDPASSGELSSGPLRDMVLQFLELKRQKSILKINQEAIRNECDIRALVSQHLPPKSVILCLLERYETVLYPLFPFEDRNFCSSEDISRILDPSQSCDHAFLAKLFLIMGITVLSITEEELENHPELKLLKNVNTSLYQAVAQRCLKENDIMRKNHSRYNLQAHLLMVLYFQLCPEDDTTSDYSHGRNMLGFVITMARSRGVHVDPKQLGGTLERGEGCLNVWRSIWHTLMDLDATCAMTRGLYPRFDSDASYDTALPEIDPDMDDAEVQLIRDFEFMARRVKLHRKVAAALLQRKSPPSAGQVMKCIDELESFTAVEFTGLDGIIKSDILPVSKLKKAVALFGLDSSVLWLKVKLLNHFQRTNNIKMITTLSFELAKLATRSLNFALNTYYNADTYFGSALAFYLRAKLIETVPRLILIFGSLFARCLQTLALTPVSDQIRVGKVKALKTSIMVNMDRMAQLSRKLSMGHYNAQRFSLIIFYFVNKLKDPSFDFEKAVTGLKSSSLPELQGFPYDLDGSEQLEIPNSNFLMHLVDAELDQLKEIFDCDITEVLRPLNGDPFKTVNPGSQIFKSGRGVHIYRFDPMEPEAALAAHMVSIEASVGSISKKYRFDKIMKALPDEAPITSDKKTQDLERELLHASEQYQVTPLTVSSDEFTDLFGLLDGFAWPAPIEDASSELD